MCCNQDPHSQNNKQTRTPRVSSEPQEKPVVQRLKEQCSGSGNSNAKALEERMSWGCVV